jgi:dihydrofolate synthase/folylpolyglutamate synthase
VLIDAAHNVAGAEALARYLALSGGAPLPVVLAVMKDKNVDGIIAALTPVASRFVATRVASPRALPAAELRARIGEAVPHLPVAIVEAPIDAVDAATADERCAVAAGSIFLVGPLRGGLVARGAVSLQGS